MSAFGCRLNRSMQQFVRYWTDSGQSSALARDAPVALLNFFGKKNSFGRLRARHTRNFTIRPDLLGIPGLSVFGTADHSPAR
jgi:hypothetical protein